MKPLPLKFDHGLWGCSTRKGQDNGDFLNAWLIWHGRNMSHMRQETRNPKQTAMRAIKATQSNARDSHSIKDTGFNFVAARRPVPLTKGGIRDAYGQIRLG